ncbi:unnamed protein product [Acanthosepion pharaonis]|uniref:Uncharacterized protein n=1 Tax=Acanthosepion pharaonis TaxID=158019 RepID=A0A812AVH4_ACAPH|nr:unnamed protein product [Sepia pharaonis]
MLWPLIDVRLTATRATTMVMLRFLLFFHQFCLLFSSFIFLCLSVCLLVSFCLSSLFRNANHPRFFFNPLIRYLFIFVISSFLASFFDFFSSNLFFVFFICFISFLFPNLLYRFSFSFFISFVIFKTLLFLSVFLSFSLISYSFAFIVFTIFTVFNFSLVYFSFTHFSSLLGFLCVHLIHLYICLHLYFFFIFFFHNIFLYCSYLAYPFSFSFAFRIFSFSSSFPPLFYSVSLLLPVFLSSNFTFLSINYYDYILLMYLD